MSHLPLLRKSLINPSTFKFSRSLSTSRTFVPLIPKHKAIVPISFYRNQIQSRTVASSVSHNPPSENARHAALNAKEEAKTFAQEVAKTIAGSNYTKGQHQYAEGGFTDITAAIASEVPRPVMVTGLAGSLPYIGTAASTLYYANEAGKLAMGHGSGVDYDTAMQLLEAAQSVQVTYGAVMLSFLGALHWGMEFSGYGGHFGYKRLGLGAAPVVAGWATLALAPPVALAAQWGAFTTLWYADMKATSAGWTPQWFSQYRFYLSILVGTCIIATLMGESYLNPPITAGMYIKQDNTEAAKGGISDVSVRNTTVSASGTTNEDLSSGGVISGKTKALGDKEAVEGDGSYVFIHTKPSSKHKEEKDSASESEHEA